MRLIKAAELADEWDMTEAELLRAVRRNGWPRVKIKRSDIRFTEQQIEQIVAMQSQAGKPVAKKSTGQTARSAKRAS